jgi:hypothetical protein
MFQLSKHNGILTKSKKIHQLNYNNILKKTIKISDEVFIKLDYINPYMPTYVNKNYLNLNPNVINNKILINYFIINNINRNLNIKNIDVEYEKFKLYIPYVNINVIKKYNDMDIAIEKENNEKEICRIIQIKNKFIEMIQNDEFKCAHLINQENDKINIINSVKENNKERTSFCDLQYAKQKKVFKNTEELLKKFDNFFSHNKYVHDKKIKYIAIIIYDLFDLYIESLKYNLKILNDKSLNICKSLLSPIDLKYFIFNEKYNYIKINHRNTLFDVFYIGMHDKKLKKCDYVKFCKISNSEKIDVIFDNDAI